MEMMKTAPPNPRGAGGVLLCGDTVLTGRYKSDWIKGKVLPVLADNRIEMNRKRISPP
jgi:hypothetical protein